MAGELPDESAFAAEFPGASLLDSRTARTIEVVGAQMEATIAATCRGHGLSHAALNALAVIDGAATPLTAGEVASSMHMTSGSMTSLLDTLERNGWVTRGTHDDDRRKVLLHLTDAGRDKVDGVLPEIQALVRTLLADLSDRQKQDLLVLLEKAAASMAAFDGEVPAPAPRNRPRPPH